MIRRVSRLLLWRQRIAADLAKPATAATGRAVVTAGDIAGGFGPIHRANAIEQLAAELIIENDFQGTVLVRKLPVAHRLPESLLD